MQTNLARLSRQSLAHRLQKPSVFPSFPTKAWSNTNEIVTLFPLTAKFPHSNSNAAFPEEKTILFNDPSATNSLDFSLESLKPTSQEFLDRSIELAAEKIQEIVKELSPLERECLKKFVIGAMSHGAINYQAHAMLAAGANLCAFFLNETAKLSSNSEKLAKTSVKDLQNSFREFLQTADPGSYGPKSNSGEGGELAIRDNSLSQSFIRQVASGRFGVSLRYLSHARELQIKINQGAKPGVGGQLPGSKVTKEIAKARYAVPGLSLISPPPHHDIYSIEDLRQLIYDLRSVNPTARISVKIASLAGCGTIAVGIAKCFPQKRADDLLDISIAGPGGTGAATLTDKHEINQPWETALAEIHQALVSEGLRNRVSLTISGGIQTGLDSFKAILLGADCVETGSGALVSLGCIMVRKCHEGDCPTGIATNKQELIDLKFKGRPEHVAKYLASLAKSLAKYLKMYGFSSPKQAVGRTDLLEVEKGSPLSGLEKLLQRKNRAVATPALKPCYFEENRAGSSDLEQQIIDGISKGVTYFRPQASNDVLSFGARIGFFQEKEEIFTSPVTVDFTGLANGQSFGFCAPKGLTLIVENANDGTGKALSGGEIYVRGLAGNCLGYGAIEGFIAAKECGDRAGIRLSYNAQIMVKRLGNNAFNFMTGGYGIILGEIEHYPGILQEKQDTFKGNQRQITEFLTARHVVGPNLGSGFTGGVIILPKTLEKELRNKGFFSKSMAEMKSSQLEDKDIDVLFNNLKKFQAIIGKDDVVCSLLQREKRDIAQFFVKYEPKNQTKASPQKIPGESKENKSQNNKNSQTASVDALKCSNKFENSLKTFENMLASAKNAELPINKEKLPPIPSKTFSEPLQAEAKSIEIPEEVNTTHEFDSCGVAMLASLSKQPSRDLVVKSLQMISRFHHRGSIGTDPKTGDGCGLMFFGFHSFFLRKMPEAFEKSKNSQFGVIFVAFPQEYSLNESKERFLYHLIQQEGTKVLGVREVPVNNKFLGYLARKQTYYYRQYLVIEGEGGTAQGVHMNIAEDLEIKLMKIRLRFELELQKEKNTQIPHIFSSSSQYLIYKGLFKEKYFQEFFVDLQDADFEASLAISHVRFATNTLPQFKNIQPLARLANNGENNNLALIERHLAEDPFMKDVLHITPNLWTMSDSHILSLFFDYYFLKVARNSPESQKAVKIIKSAIHPYYPENLQSSLVSSYYNIFGVPFEGPNASIALLDQKVAIYRDRNGFRPLRGLINQDLLYIGSELGPIELESGKAFNLPPAEPVFFDLSADKTQKLLGFYEETPEELAALEKSWQKLAKALNLAGSKFEEIHNKMFQRSQKLVTHAFTTSEIQLLKLRVNWTSELQENIMSKLFSGEELLSSMADQGPLESLVFGSFLDFNGMFKAKFSQVTNPPLAKREEECYMSGLTFIGKKPTLESLVEQNFVGKNQGKLNEGSENINGIVLASPIVDNKELAAILLDERVKAMELPILYPLEGYEEALRIQLTILAESAVNLVKSNQANVIILTDIAINEEENAGLGPIPCVLAASVVDRALMMAGIRREVSLILSSAQLLIGRDMAQAISIGSVELVNPYLPFIKEQHEKLDEFNKRTKNYKEKMKQEVFGFMARMGISSVSAYRGAKVFQGFGVDKDLANLYGVQSEFGGFGLKDLANLVYSNFHAPKKQGYGKYDGVTREFIWKGDVAQLAIKAIRSQEKQENHEFFKRFEKEADVLKRGNPRGWLKLVKPSAYSEHNPLNVCILGGGASGFYQAEALLDSHLPVKVTIIEEKHVNLFGLVGEGVAPDHVSTKKQGYILKKCLDDERVEYFGGLSAGTDIPIETLQEQFPCIIDCRGASEDIKLGIPGENLDSVLAASQVYSCYNGVFNPKRTTDWPFNQNSRNPAVGIIGSGNVSADLVRILLADHENLEETSINPGFLKHLKDQAPQIVYVFARGGPQDSKISLKELEEIENAGLWISSWFDESKLSKESFDEKQRQLYAFYKRFHNNPRKNFGLKRLYFFFQHTPAEFKQVGADVELRFANQPSKYRFKNVITALGRKPSTTSLMKNAYLTGWAAGKGGNLKTAEASAKNTLEKILKDFNENRFAVPNNSFKEENQTWHLKSSVNKQEFLNILSSVQEKKLNITNAKEFHLAKTAINNNDASNNAKNMKRKKLDMNNFKEIQPDPDALTIFNGESTVKIQTENQESLLKALKNLQNKGIKNFTPQYECDGEGTCGTCGLDIINSNGNSQFKQAKKEKQLLEINGFTENSLLSCQHGCNKMKGFVLYVEKKNPNGQEKINVSEEKNIEGINN